MTNKNEKVKLSKRSKRFYEKQRVKAEKIINNKRKISNLIRKARKIFERLDKVPRCKGLSQNICNFCDLLSDYFDGIYRNLPVSTIVALVAGLLYVVLPIDVLADFIPVLGWLDDAAVMSFVIAAEQKDLQKYLSWKEQQPITDNEPKIEI